MGTKVFSSEFLKQLEQGIRQIEIVKIKLISIDRDGKGITLGYLLCDGWAGEVHIDIDNVINVVLPFDAEMKVVLVSPNKNNLV